MDKITYQLISNQIFPFFDGRVLLTKKYLRYKKCQHMVCSNTPLEVVIPCIERDIDILPLTINSVRKFLLHPIHRICIVSPQKSSVINLCKQLKCVFFDENSVLPIKLSDIGDYLVEGRDRRGWLFQ